MSYVTMVVLHLVWSSLKCLMAFEATITVFLKSDTRLPFVSLLVLVQLLFEGSVYFLGKHTDINDGWIKYI